MIGKNFGGVGFAIAIGVSNQSNAVVESCVGFVRIGMMFEYVGNAIFYR